MKNLFGRNILRSLLIGWLLVLSVLTLLIIILIRPAMLYPESAITSEAESLIREAGKKVEVIELIDASAKVFEHPDSDSLSILCHIFVLNRMGDSRRSEYTLYTDMLIREMIMEEVEKAVREKEWKARLIYDIRFLSR